MKRNPASPFFLHNSKLLVVHFCLGTDSKYDHENRWWRWETPPESGWKSNGEGNESLSPHIYVRVFETEHFIDHRHFFLESHEKARS